MRQDGAANGADAGQTRSLPSHLRYVPLSAEVPPDEKRTPSMLTAELKGQVTLVAPLVRPRIVGLLNMADFTHNTDSVVPLDEPIFQPSPPEVVFDKFEPFQKYTTQLRMRNNDNVNRRIKRLKPESTAFSIEMVAGSKAGAGKVAPGMEVVFKVHFAPRAAQDYHCDLVCMSEREKFVVAVSARGPRACFEFPDGVDFGLQPVRVLAVQQCVRMGLQSVASAHALWKAGGGVGGGRPATMQPAAPGKRPIQSIQTRPDQTRHSDSPPLPSRLPIQSLCQALPACGSLIRC